MNEPQPMFGREILFWVIMGVLLIFLVALLRDILLPFVLGLVIAYLLDPLADRLQRFGFSRLWAAFFILLLFAMSFIALDACCPCDG